MHTRADAIVISIERGDMHVASMNQNVLILGKTNEKNFGKFVMKTRLNKRSFTYHRKVIKVFPLMHNRIEHYFHPCDDDGLQLHCNENVYV